MFDLWETFLFCTIRDYIQLGSLHPNSTVACDFLPKMWWNKGKKCTSSWQIWGIHHWSNIIVGMYDRWALTTEIERSVEAVRPDMTTEQIYKIFNFYWIVNEIKVTKLKLHTKLQEIKVMQKWKKAVTIFHT